jgi:putative flippase GtrA
VISSKTYIAFTKFGIVGGLSFLVDMTVYYASDVFLPSYIAKALGIVVATGVNYKLNSWWTWGVKKGDIQSSAQPSVLRNYLLLYAMSGSLNVLTNELMLSVLPDWILQLNVVFPKGVSVVEVAQNTLLNTKQFFAVKIDKLFAVLVATVVGMMVNFIGQKLWVFGKSKSEG